MKEILFTIIFLYGIYSLCVIIDLLKYKFLFKKVKWCISESILDPDPSHRIDDLISFQIGKAQSELLTDEDLRLHIYRDDNEDTSHLRTILHLYQIDLSEKYFMQKLPFNNRIRKMTSEDFFWTTLCIYLEKHENKKEIVKGIEKYTEKGIYYLLTPQGLAYEKLYLLSQLRCGSLDSIVEDTKSIIKSGDLCFPRHHRIL